MQIAKMYLRTTVGRRARPPRATSRDLARRSAVNGAREDRLHGRHPNVGTPRGSECNSLDGQPYIARRRLGVAFGHRGQRRE